jgi:hypothetical protein
MDMNFKQSTAFSNLKALKGLLAGAILVAFSGGTFATTTAVSTPGLFELPIFMSVTVYDSAGELIRNLFMNGKCQVQPECFTIDSNKLIVGQKPIVLTFSGQLQGEGNSLTWNGRNNAGEKVRQGQYTIIAKFTDQFGHVTPACTKTIKVVD